MLSTIHLQLYQFSLVCRKNPLIFVFFFSFFFLSVQCCLWKKWTKITFIFIINNGNRYTSRILLGVNNLPNDFYDIFMLCYWIGEKKIEENQNGKSIKITKMKWLMSPPQCKSQLKNSILLVNRNWERNLWNVQNVNFH